MNYYEHHIGDYAEATAHLSFVEDAAYSRLLRKYYATEKPIPTDIRAAQRLVAARTRDERDAVQRVLEEFFELTPDGWRHHRCDREINSYQAGQPQREAKKRNEDTRLARHRADRAALFAVINDAGQHLPWNCPMSELRAAVARISSAETATPATDSATPPATAPATPATATHTRAPLPTPHSPLPTSHPPTITDTHSAQPEAAPPHEQPDPRVFKASAVVLAMKAEGIGGCNPGHPKLAELLSAGAEVQNFVSAAQAAVEKHKGFAYALGIVEGQMAEARQLAAGASAKAVNSHVNGSNGAKSTRRSIAEFEQGVRALNEQFAAERAQLAEEKPREH